MTRFYGVCYHFIKTFNILLATILFIIILLCAQTGLFEFFNNNIYDLFLNLDLTDKKDNRIAIIKVDAPSQDKLGKWPWNRIYHVQLLNNLFQNGAKVVAFDFKFDTPSNKTVDYIFHDTLKRYPTVILDSTEPQINSKRFIFWEQFKKDLNPGNAFFTFNTNDGILRKMQILLGKKPAFGFLALCLYNPERFKILNDNQSALIRGKLYEKINNKEFLINFKRNTADYKTYSYIDVLEGKIARNEFKNKIVLIGITLSGFNQNFRTPVLWYKNARVKKIQGKLNDYSIFYQAQIIDSLLSFNLIQEFNITYYYSLLFVYILILINILKRSGMLNQVLLVVGIIIFLGYSSFFLLKYYQIWFSPVSFGVISILIFITISIANTLQISGFLDNYISQIKYKNETASSIIQQPIDKKINTLIELTNLINKDRTVLETVLNSVNSIILLFDKQGLIIYSNNADYCQEKLTIQQIFSELNLNDIIDNVSHNNIYRKNLSYENNHYEFITNITNEGLYVGILNNITDMVNMAEMKTTILSMLSHEMKTPLTTILICSDYMHELNKNSAMDDYISRVGLQTEFLQNLIDDFLTLNKMEVSDFQLNKEFWNINNLISSIIESLNIIAQQKSITINFIPDISISDNILFDKQYMHIAIKNLIDNSIKYSPENTRIFVSTLLADQTLSISIKDEGFGISAEDQKNLFNKFYRVKNKKTQGIKGTGLGLAFVRRIIELHGGKININSELDAGTEFKITLPID